MEKLLVVEDEPLERAALCGMLKKMYGDQVTVFEAADGMEALEICAAESPSVILADINMPGMSGLELVRNLTDTGYRGKILMVTAYDTSGYIREALKLGVIDYLLKSVRRRELQEAVDKCFSLLQKDRDQDRREAERTEAATYAEQYVVSDILNGRYPFSTLETVYGWNRDGNLAVCMLTSDHPLTETASLKTCFTVCHDRINNEEIYFLNYIRQDPRQKQRFILERVIRDVWEASGRPSLTVSNYCASYAELSAVCKKLPAYAPESGHAIHRPPRFAHTAADQLPSAERDKLRIKWYQRLLEGNAENFVRAFRRKAAALEDFWGCASLFAQIMDTEFPDTDAHELLTIFQMDKPYAELERWIEKHYRPSEDRDPITAAVNYMKKHYAEDIVREDLSGMLGLNDTYFSHLFKQQTGKGFVQMLNEIRIAHAKELLDRGCSADQTADACGYYSRKYFLDVFKRITGISVSAYQRGQKE